MEKQINTQASNIAWKGKKVLGSHSGTIDLKDGKFKFENDEIVGGEFVMDMTTITVTDLKGDDKAGLEGHLNSDDFFGVDNHPTSTLVITSVAKKDDGTYGVVGDLTIKENTHPVTFDLDYNNNTATTKLTIDRSKYNVKYNSGSFFSGLGDQTIYDNFDLNIELKF
ncbi:YceI family protein [Salegentibacter salarius]|uniref:Lipid-binding protein n=1 Tax=Salegentibacter salarius TaxID=435906 RepID=A0A2N0TWB8_9FLAO|nr:YceI family protein [Salegentibacter salarius]OEY72686.1 lipid-binding protein [Salegentibacter salarius]PKD19019.1 lipid-binding protein [Salegentibacter salarius]SLK00973.1 Polyisoprenoid-binding protein YceI [Salegentibacter salarius]